MEKPEQVKKPAKKPAKKNERKVAPAQVSRQPDPTNPAHYRSHPSGVECITVTEHLGFCLGNAIKYIWRAGERPEREVEDLRKAVWYLEREIARLERPIPYKLAPGAAK